MNQRERVIEQIRHRSTDFIPVANLEFEGDVADRLDRFYGSNGWRDQLIRSDHIVRITGDMRYGIHTDTSTVRFTDIYGTTWRSDLRPLHLEDAPLENPTLEGYRFPEMRDVLEKDWRRRIDQEIAGNRDRFLVLGTGCGLFQRSWFMRGYQNALMDSISEPRFYEELVVRNLELNLTIIKELVTAPVDGIMFSDDWGDQRGIILGPDRWRRFIKPHAARLFEAAHSAGKFTLHHSCGNVQDIIPDLIEIGLDVLQSVQPEVMNPYELKARYGKDITFWGGLGSQRLVPFGTPGEIRAEVRKLCRVMGNGGGYILGPTKALQPETPTENAAAVVESFLEEVGESALSE